MAQNIKNDNILIDAKSLYFLVFHFRFSSLFYSTQLSEMLTYEVMSSNSVNSKAGFGRGVSTLVVYNFHLLNTQNRFFIFLQASTNFTPGNHKLNINNAALLSITELFSAANWLERELSELHGVSFSGKKDLRNLMLQYGDSTAPFQKSFPSIGMTEMYYNPIKDTIVQNPISVQI